MRLIAFIMEPVVVEKILNRYAIPPSAITVLRPVGAGLCPEFGAKWSRVQVLMDVSDFCGEMNGMGKGNGVEWGQCSGKRGKLCVCFAYSW